MNSKLLPQKWPENDPFSFWNGICCIYAGQEDKMNRNYFSLISALTLLILSSCSPDSKFREEERSLIDNHIASAGFNPEPDADGIFYRELKAGNGRQMQIGDSVGVFYEMKYLDGTVVTSNYNEKTPLRFCIGSPGIPDGWNSVLARMRKGSKALMLLPSEMAYGSEGYGYVDAHGKYITVIPGYTPLIYEMEVAEHTPAKN